MNDREMFEQAYREHLGGGAGDTVRRIAFIGGYRARSWQIDRIAEAAGIYEYPGVTHAASLRSMVSSANTIILGMGNSPVLYRWSVDAWTPTSVASPEIVQRRRFIQARNSSPVIDRPPLIPVMRASYTVTTKDATDTR